jgi:hypothetical protein
MGRNGFCIICDDMWGCLTAFPGAIVTRLLHCMQDAALACNAAIEEDNEAVEDGRRRGPLQGRLPNLHLGLVGEDVLRSHPRYVPLAAVPELPAGVPVPDKDLPSVPQRSQAWFAARRSAITGSTAAIWLGLKEPSAAKALATAKLKVYPGDGHAELTRAFQALLAERKGSPAPVHAAGPLTAFSSCAMEMGTVKEPDVFLTYAHYMDDAKM